MPADTLVKRHEVSSTSLENAAKIKALQRRRSSDLHTFRSISYIETLIHLLKGNIGSGMMAMGFAFANGGLILAPILTLILAVICIHSQHQLLISAKVMQARALRNHTPNFANTVEFAFTLGPPNVQKYAPHLRAYVLISLCVTQIGFGCIDFVFIANSMLKVLDYFEVVYEYRKMYVICLSCILLPIILTCLIRDLKFLVPFSFIANLLMLFAITTTIYLMSDGLTTADISDRKYVASYSQIPLFLGTTVYAFVGIGLILPLQKQMKEEKQFGSKWGVLNVGMSIVTLLLILVGTIGYMRYGDDAKGSLNLNLPQNEILPLCVNIAIATAVLFTYALIMHVPVLIIFPTMSGKWGPFNHPILVEMTLRTSIVLLTFVIAAIVPHLELVIALVGSVASTSLALLIPAMLDTAVQWEFGITKFTIIKNILIFSLGVVVFITGTVMSLIDIVNTLKKDLQ